MGANVKSIPDKKASQAKQSASSAAKKERADKRKAKASTVKAKKSKAAAAAGSADQVATDAQEDAEAGKNLTLDYIYVNILSQCIYYFVRI